MAGGQKKFMLVPTSFLKEGCDDGEGDSSTNSSTCVDSGSSSLSTIPHNSRCQVRLDASQRHDGLSQYSFYRPSSQLSTSVSPQVGAGRPVESDTAADHRIPKVRTLCGVKVLQSSGRSVVGYQARLPSKFAVQRESTEPTRYKIVPVSMQSVAGTSVRPSTSFDLPANNDTVVDDELCSFGAGDDGDDFDVDQIQHYRPQWSHNYRQRQEEIGDQSDQYIRRNTVEAKVVSNENNRYTIVGLTSGGQPIYSLRSVQLNEFPHSQTGVQPVPQVVPVKSRYFTLQPSHVSSMRPSEAKYFIPPVKQRKPTNVDDFDEESETQSSSDGQKFVMVSDRVRRRIQSQEQIIDEKFSDSASAAQAGAIQRFSTKAGWDQMANWLKKAESSKDWNKLKLLLSQCEQATVTLELLQSNDTPKLVRRLSKICLNGDVRKSAQNLIKNWKLVVAAPQTFQEDQKRVGSLKRKTPHPFSAYSKKVAVSSGGAEIRKISTVPRISAPSSSADSEVKLEKNMQGVDDKSADINESKKSGLTEKTGKDSAEKGLENQKVEMKESSNKINEYNMFEKLNEASEDRTKRPRIAKTFNSKFRSTGLEGDDSSDTVSEKSKGKMPRSISNAPASKTPSLTSAFQSATTPKTSSNVSSPPSSSVSGVCSSPNLEKTVAVTGPPRVRMSNTFMDALMDPVKKKPFAKIVRKKAVQPAKSSTSVMPSVMEGLYSDTTKATHVEKKNEEQADDNILKKTKIDEFDIAPIARRKIRFADEIGQDLVHTRLFEVEEGERLNVSKLSSEDMKHLEMLRERSFMQEHRGLHSPDDYFGPVEEGTSIIPWKLRELIGACSLIVRGSQSQAKLVEEERQKTVMRLFYDPSQLAEISEADEPIQPVTHSAISEIPLEVIEEDVQLGPIIVPHESTDECSIQSGGSFEKLKSMDMQKLISQLKKAGIVSSGSDLASILSKVTSASTATEKANVSPSSTVPNATVAANPILSTQAAPTLLRPGYAVPAVSGQGSIIREQQPLLNGPVPAGVVPTVGVDYTPQTTFHSSEQYPSGISQRYSGKTCTFYQSGSCSYGSRCRYGHEGVTNICARNAVSSRSDVSGVSDERGRGYRGGHSSRGSRGKFARDGFAGHEYRNSAKRGRYRRDHRRSDRYGRRRGCDSKSKSRSRSRSPTRKYRLAGKSFSKDTVVSKVGRFPRINAENEQRNAELSVEYDLPEVSEGQNSKINAQSSNAEIGC